MTGNIQTTLTIVRPRALRQPTVRWIDPDQIGISFFQSNFLKDAEHLAGWSVPPGGDARFWRAR
jgi:hypothetical protein